MSTSAVDLELAMLVNTMLVNTMFVNRPASASAATQTKKEPARTPKQKRPPGRLSRRDLNIGEVSNRERLTRHDEECQEEIREAVERRNAGRPQPDVRLGDGVAKRHPDRELRAGRNRRERLRKRPVPESRHQ